MAKEIGGQLRLDREDALNAIRELNEDPKAHQDPRIMRLMVLAMASLNEIIDLEERLGALEDEFEAGN